MILNRIFGSFTDIHFSSIFFRVSEIIFNMHIIKINMYIDYIMSTTS